MKDESWFHFEGIFLDPGDFHMMKCAMVVIRDVSEEAGIDTSIAELYKGATHRAVLSVAHFKKSLRAIKLFYTALSIVINNRFIITLPTIMIDEMKLCMNQMSTDLTDIEENSNWYTLVLDYLAKHNWRDIFNMWITNSCDKNLKFRFWTFVLFDLITCLKQWSLSILCLYVHTLWAYY